jgi:hypothetical protein
MDPQLKFTRKTSNTLKIIALELEEVPHQSLSETVRINLIHQDQHKHKPLLEETSKYTDR